MITRKDRQLLLQDMKEVFATRDDLVNELKPIKNGMRQLNKRYKETVSFFDKIVSHHHARLVQLEEHAGVKPPPYVGLFPLKN